MNNMDSKRIQQGISDLAEKKQMLIMSLQTDIEAIDSEMSEAFRELGLKAYALAKESGSIPAGLEGDCDKIDGFKSEQNFKDKKKLEVAERYDEEIAMLEKLLPKTPTPPPLAPPPTAQPAQSAPSPRPAVTEKFFCTNCGKRYTPGNDVFCLECGTKLKQ